MILHLGDGETVALRDVIAIFHFENTQSSGVTQEFLKRAEDLGRIRKISKEQTKSIILAKVDGSYIIYFSPISSSTLLKRMEYGESFEEKQKK